MQGGIRTPEQRVRVFVSSTLQELADERAAARDAITRLHLTPVMFELAARPHPPQDLYRSYLDQSDVFVGIYWQSYGWVAPGATVSGIEDELMAAGERPRLIYVKEPAPARERALGEMLERIIENGRVSFRSFGTPESLGELLVDDLALLVSERFHAGSEAGLSAGTLTFLFADVEGSTPLLEELGDDYTEVVQRYHATVGEAIGRQGGRLESRAGDGVFAVFADAAAAVEAAVEIHRVLSAQSWPRGVAVRARTGIHTGLAVAQKEGYVGLDVHRAARVGDAAQGGQILVSSATAALLADEARTRGWTLRDLGEFDLRGLSRPERISQVLAEGVHDEPAPPRARRLGASRAPTPITSLVGRRRELEELEDLLTRPQVRLITLTGAGGIGKTRLAMEVVRSVSPRFADGVGWVELDTVTQPALVADAIARALGLIDTGRQAILDTVADFLSDKEMLVVLDNFEQVAEAAPLVTELLDRAPQLTVLVTSRAPLRVRAEQELPVGVLPYPEDGAFGDETSYAAVELFIDRARAANPHLILDSDRLESIAQITSQLDGLPLAIELAAARTRYLDPRAVAGRMDSLLDLLTRGARDLPERHRTMRETIGWSERLLDGSTRRLFRRLAVFRSPPSIDAVAAVTNWDESIRADLLAELETLADVGLIGLRAPSLGDEPQVSMLRVVREYALNELAANDEVDATFRAHADYFLQLVDEAGPQLWSPQRRALLDLLEHHQADIGAALETLSSANETAAIWKLAAGIGLYVVLRGPHGQAVRMMKELGIVPTAVPPGVPDLVAGRALQSAGAVQFITGDFIGSLPYLRKSVDLLAASGATREMARAMAYFGIAGISTGDPSTMVELASARARGEELGDLPAFALAGTFAAEVASALGDRDGALELLRSVEAACRSAGDQWLLGLALMGKGSLLIVTDDFVSAIAVTEECEALLSVEHPSVLGWPQVGLAYCHLRTDAADVARKYFGDAIATGRRTGDRTVVLGGLLGLAGVAACEGDGDLGGRLLGAAEAVQESMGYQLWSATEHMYRWVVSSLVDTFGPDEIERAKAEGHRLTYEESLALALG